MTTTEQIMRRFADRPSEAAERLVRLYGSDDAELRQAAETWCHAASSGAALSISIGHDAAVWALLKATGPFPEPYATWFSRTSGRHPGALANWYDDTLLEALVTLWPIRDEPSLYVGRLIAWATSKISCPGWRGDCGGGPLHLLEQKLRDDADIAYPVGTAMRECHVAECRHSRSVDLVRLALLRRADGSPQTDTDRRLITEASAGWLIGRDDGLFPAFRAALSVGMAVPTEVAGRITEALAGRRGTPEWLTAVWILAAIPEEHARVVTIVAEALAPIQEPVPAFEYLVRPVVPRVRTPLFSGPGWGRDQLPKKLLPITRVMLRRRIWPTESWMHAFEADSEGRFARVAEVLAEGLLDRALDNAEPIEVRRAAISALVHLQPGGNGSVVRALGKLHSTELDTEARQAQRQLRDSRAGRVDRELAILDAWEVFEGACSECTGNA